MIKTYALIGAAVTAFALVGCDENKNDQTGHGDGAGGWTKFEAACKERSGTATKDGKQFTCKGADGQVIVIDVD